MSAPDRPPLPVDVAEIEAALSAGAAGDRRTEAAVALFIAAGWVAVRVFVIKHVDYVAAADVAAATARVDWTAAAAGSRGDGEAARLLLVAASLGGGVPVDLRACLDGLSSIGFRAVVSALAHVHG